MSYIWKKLLGLVILAVFFNSIDSTIDKNINLTKFHDIAKPVTIRRTKRAPDQNKLIPENTMNYRLPNNVIPSEYFIHLTPFIIPDNFTFNGRVKIIANIKNPTSTIVLHSKRIKIHNVMIRVLRENNNPSNSLDILEITRIKKYEFLNITLKSSLAAGRNISVDILYTGKLNNDMKGFYRSSYKIGNRTKWIAATHLEPTSARMLFPCFDEPALKAVFHIKVVPPRTYIVLSNMPIKSIARDNTVEFEETPVMSTYLVAIVVCDFESRQSFGRNPLYRVWSSKNLVHQLPYALSIMQKMVRLLSDRLGVPYTLPKLDMIAMPDFGKGAMENWGLLTYRETLMLYDPDVTPLVQKQRIRNTITHEIAHLWFGNLVTPSWWDDVWLSEGFAKYFDKHIYDNATISWNLESDFVVDNLHFAFSYDALPNSHPLSNKVYSTSRIVAMFDPLTYHKGASIIRMLEKLLGSKMFFGALRRYLQSNLYSVVTPDSLYSAIEDELKFNNYTLNVKVSDFMNSWVLQSGFPVIDARFAGDSVLLTQRRFFLRQPKKIDQTIWFVPINWATKSNPNFNDSRKITWLNTKERVINIRNASSDWVILNVQQAGYYRVNYDKNMWKRIIEALKSDDYGMIHEINRASLVDDLFNLARVGMVDCDIALIGSQYLIQETSYIVWKAAFANLAYLKKRFIGHTNIFNYYKTYVISLLKPNYERLGFNEIVGEKDIDVLLRQMVLLWLCKLEHHECIKESLIAFEKSQQNDSFSLSPNQQALIYCTAIKYGSNERWNYLWKKFKESNYITEKLIIISGLACSENPATLKRLLSEAITPNQEIKKQNAHYVFGYVIHSSLIGIQTTLEFIDINYKKMVDYIGNQMVSGILSTLSKFLSTKEHVQKFRDIIENNKKSMSNTLKSVQDFLRYSVAELDWYEKNVQNILNWLKTNTS